MDEKVIKNLVNGLKSYDHLNQLSDTLQKIQDCRMDKNMHLNSKILISSVVSEFEKILAENRTSFVLEFLRKVPQLLNKSRGKIFQSLKSKFNPRIFAQIPFTAAQSKQADEWTKFTADCLVNLYDIRAQELESINTEEIILSSSSAIQEKSVETTLLALVELMKVRPSGTVLNFSKIMQLIPKKDIFLETTNVTLLPSHAEKLLSSTIENVPRSILARKRTDIQNFAIDHKSYKLLSHLYDQFGSIVIIDLFKEKDNLTIIEDLVKSEHASELSVQHKFLINILASGIFPEKEYLKLQKVLVKKFLLEKPSNCDYQIFEAMITQPNPKLRPLQIGINLLNKIISNHKTRSSDKRLARKLLGLISVILQPVAKQVVIKKSIEITERIEQEVNAGEKSVEQTVTEVDETIPSKRLKIDEPAIESVDETTVLDENLRGDQIETHYIDTSFTKESGETKQKQCTVEVVIENNEKIKEIEETKDIGPSVEEMLDDLIC